MSRTPSSWYYYPLRCMLLSSVLLIAGAMALDGVRYVLVASTVSTLVLNEVQVFPCESSTNVALNKSASGSASRSPPCVNSVLRLPSLAVDGRTSCLTNFEDTFCTDVGGRYWEVDLGAVYNICTVVILQSIKNAAPSANVLQFKGNTGQVRYQASLPDGTDGMQVTCTSSSCSVVEALCEACTLSRCGGGAPNAVAASGFFPACTCTCSSRYTGAYCQEGTLCTTLQDCSGHASAVSGRYGACMCTCLPEWTGVNCSISNVCTNRTDCSGAATNVSGNRPACSCTCMPGYAGASCASRVCALGVDCNATGTRAVRGVYPSCLCDCKKGFGGPWCARLLTRSASEAFTASSSTSTSSTRGAATATMGSASGTVTTAVSRSNDTPTLSTTTSPSPSLSQLSSRGASETLSVLAWTHSASWSGGGSTPSASISNGLGSRSWPTVTASRSASHSGCRDAPPVVFIVTNAGAACGVVVGNSSEGGNSSTAGGNGTAAAPSPQCLELRDHATIDGLVVRAAQLPRGLSLAHPLRIAFRIATASSAPIPGAADARTAPSSWHVASVFNSSTLHNTTVVHAGGVGNGNNNSSSIDGLLVSTPSFGGTTVMAIELICATERHIAQILIHWPARPYDGAVDGATVGALFASASLGGDLSPMASLAMVSLLSCTSTPPPLGMSAYVLSPFYDHGPLAIATGNVGLVATVAAVQLLAAALLSRSPAPPCADGRSPFMAAASSVRFPAITVRVAEFLLPGTCFGTVLCLWSTRSVDVAFGVLAVLIVLAALVDSQMVLYRVVLPRTTFVPYGLFPSVEEETGAASSACSCCPHPHPLEARVLFPKTQWQPKHMRRAFGPLMVAYRRRFVGLRVCDALVPLTLSVATGVGVASQGTANCEAMTIAVGVVHFGFAVVLVALRPHRCPADRLLAPVVYALFGTVCLLKPNDDDDDTAVGSTVTPAIQVAIACTLIAKTMCSRWVWFREWQWAGAELPLVGGSMCDRLAHLLLGHSDDAHRGTKSINGDSPNYALSETLLSPKDHGGGGDGLDADDGSGGPMSDVEMILMCCDPNPSLPPLVRLLDSSTMLQQEAHFAEEEEEGNNSSTQALSFCGNERYFNVAPAAS